MTITVTLNDGTSYEVKNVKAFSSSIDRPNVLVIQTYGNEPQANRNVRGFTVEDAPLDFDEPCRCGHPNCGYCA